MMNKPRGLVTTASDEKGRATVYSLLGEILGTPWVAPVGRLDKASEGFLLTNDSEWGARIASTETHLEKTYHVQIGKVADEAILSALSRGVPIEDGDLLLVRVAIGPLQFGLLSGLVDATVVAVFVVTNARTPDRLEGLSKTSHGQPSCKQLRPLQKGSFLTGLTSDVD
jgi:hypothetical protein